MLLRICLSHVLLFLSLNPLRSDPRSVRAVASASLATAIEKLDTSRVSAFAGSASKRPERDLAVGVLLSWSGRQESSIQPLTFAVEHQSSLSRVEADQALLYLAMSEGLNQDYVAALKHGQLFLHSQRVLTGNDLADFVHQTEVWKVLATSTRMRVDPTGPTQVTLVPNTSHRLEASVQSGHETLLSLFDTGAEISVISRSALKRLGVAALPGSVHDVGSSGIETVASLAVLPQLRLGTMMAHNVPVMIEEDASMVVGPPSHRIPLDMILGEPVLRRLGTVGSVKPGILSFDQPPLKLARTARLLEVGPTLVLTATAAGEACNLLLDTGATTTMLTQSFYEAHRLMFPPGSMRSQEIVGIGGPTTVERFTLPDLTLRLVRGEQALHNVPVFSSSSALDVSGLAGNLGRDAWNGDGPFQIDFRRRTLAF